MPRLTWMLPVLFVGVMVARNGGSQAAAPAFAAQTGQSCAALETTARRLERTFDNVGPLDQVGSARLCLLTIPAEDVLKVIIIGVRDLNQFRAAKAAAGPVLTAAGVDICRIGSWEGRTPQVLELPFSDRYDLPVECRPRFFAADEGAEAWLRAVEVTSDQAIEDTAALLGWRPNRALTVRVFTDLERAIPVFQRYVVPVIPGETAASVAQQTRDGISWQLYTAGIPGYGNITLLNLTSAQRRTAAGLKASVGSTYANFAVVGLGGGGRDVQPSWFRLGLGSYLAERMSGLAFGYLAIAAQALSDGVAIPLPEMTTAEGWTAQRLRNGPRTVQARLHAALVFLIERYGFEPVIQLVRDDRDGTIDQFLELLMQLTGMDTAGLDRALDAWLGGGPAAVTGTRDADFRVDLAVSAGASYGEATVNIDRPLRCGTDRTVDAGARLSFPVVIQPDGSFSGRGYLDNAVVSVSGTLSGSSARGTLRWVATGDAEQVLRSVFSTLTGAASTQLEPVAAEACDTGPLGFVSGR